MPAHLFLFSTSATSSSVENCPLTTRIRLLMTSSEQSTSSRPPTTTGRRLGFTLTARVEEEVSSNLSPLQANGRVQCVRPHLLDINLNVLLQVVAVQVEDQVVDKVKTVTDDDERQLVSKFGFLSITHIGIKKKKSLICSNFGE